MDLPLNREHRQRGFQASREQTARLHLSPNPEECDYTLTKHLEPCKVMCGVSRVVRPASCCYNQAEKTAANAGIRTYRGKHSGLLVTMVQLRLRETRLAPRPKMNDKKGLTAQ